MAHEQTDTKRTEPQSIENLDQLIDHLQAIRAEHGGDVPVVSAYGDGYDRVECVSLDEVADLGDVPPWQGRYERSRYVDDGGKGERSQAVIIA